MFYKYSQWDGSQEIPDFDPESLMDQLSENLMSYSDLQYSLRMMFQGGFQSDQSRMPGIQDLLQKLRTQRREQLERYDLNSVLDDVLEQLERIIEKESKTIDQRLAGEPASPAGRPAPSDAGGGEARRGGDQGQTPGGLTEEEMRRLRQHANSMAEQKRQFIDSLPDDAGGQIRELTEYDFLDPEAQAEFNDLLDKLRRQVMDSHFKNLSETIENLTPEDIERMRQMLQELNEMIEQRMQGREPDFDSFMEKYGDFFEGMKPTSLDDLIEKLQRQMAMQQSLLDSLPQDSRRSLQDMLNSKIMDPRLRGQMAQLGQNLEALFPMRQMRRQYPFHGAEQLSFEQAMQVMDQLQQIDDLEKQMEHTRMGADLDNVDVDKLRDILSDEAAQNLEDLKDLTKLLEEAGYIQRDGEQFELTPRGMRRIGQRALQDIFTKLNKDRFGSHTLERSGLGTDRADDSKRYEFGDPFIIDLEKTIFNAVNRRGPSVPIKLEAEDFEVERTEHLTDTSIVLMLDLSWSMVLRGNFLPAKKTALALSSLIRSQFPRDRIYIVGFSDYARELKADGLPFLNSHEAVYGTNMQHGFIVAQKLLARHKSNNKQIIMITDGEPTAYIENGQSYFEYPPTPLIFRETLREVKRCTQKGIVINTFMLDRSEYLKEFIGQMTKLNKGRAFYTSADRLGNYILVDYLTGKRRSVA